MNDEQERFCHKILDFKGAKYMPNKFYFTIKTNYLPDVMVSSIYPIISAETKGIFNKIERLTEFTFLLTTITKLSNIYYGHKPVPSILLWSTQKLLGDVGNPLTTFLYTLLLIIHGKSPHTGYNNHPDNTRSRFWLCGATHCTTKNQNSFEFSNKILEVGYVNR